MSEKENDVHMHEGDDMGCYKKDALSVVTFKLVYEKEDLDSGMKQIQFKPDMAHQIFGESESIFGYRSLSIDLNYLHNSCECYVKVQSSGEIKDEDMKPDDVINCLNPWMPANFTTKESEFLSRIQEENHERMYGKVLSEFEDKKEVERFKGSHVFATYKITETDMSDDDFKDFHSRFETFIVWYIDAANFIDLNDDRWKIFYVYEELRHPQTNRLYRTPLGYCTVYKFFAYPCSIRARISQFFVLPSHQKRGIGLRLYRTVVDHLRAMPEVVDITVEEPTATFQKMRDVEDCRTVYRELMNVTEDFFAVGPKKVFEIMKKLKFCKRQCQRVYDVLSIALQKDSAKYSAIVDAIEKRFKDGNERETRPGKRFCNPQREVVTLQVDPTTRVETQLKRHLEDLAPSVDRLKLLL